jgi:hypothetical protein
MKAAYLIPQFEIHVKLWYCLICSYRKLNLPTSRI